MRLCLSEMPEGFAQAIGEFQAAIRQAKEHYCTACAIGECRSVVNRDPTCACCRRNHT